MLRIGNCSQVRLSYVTFIGFVLCESERADLTKLDPREMLRGVVPSGGQRSGIVSTVQVSGPFVLVNASNWSNIRCHFGKVSNWSSIVCYCGNVTDYLEFEPDISDIVVNYKTSADSARRGVSSTWLASLDPQNPRHTTHMGTGLAPFRSVIFERCSSGNKADLVLFFGCRSQHKDFYCEEDFQNFIQSGLLRMFTAFSRDQDSKMYVQHRISEQGELIWKMITSDNAYFYIAGNAKSMPDDVKEALCNVIRKHGSMTTDEAAGFLQELEKHHRFQIEAWS
ncbi:NADPH-dependent diflavin oxidoreductase 1 [Bulinus truncatus]|nr:NADPH-dependent diflavin oxidoreductase 1 [Bulinus truncatus]